MNRKKVLKILSRGLREMKRVNKELTEILKKK